jgi:signal transduction histidine kinase
MRPPPQHALSASLHIGKMRPLRRTNGQLDARTADQAAANDSLTRIDQNRCAFFANISDEPRTPVTVLLGEAQVMIRHPNTSGFHLDQVTRLHIPAFFVGRVEVAQGGEARFGMTGGIPFSEEPSVRFTSLPNGSARS